MIEGDHWHARISFQVQGSRWIKNAHLQCRSLLFQSSHRALPTAVCHLLYSRKMATCATGALSFEGCRREQCRKSIKQKSLGHTANRKHGCLNLQMGILVEACSCGCGSVNEYSAALFPKRRSAGRLAIGSGWPSVSVNLKRASLLSLY